MTRMLANSRAPMFHVEHSFTDIYRRYEHAPLPIREAMCLRAMFPHNLRPIQDGDLFAGRVVSSCVGFALEPAFAGTGYYCRVEKIRKAMEGREIGDDDRRRVEEMIDFWQDKTTHARHDAALPPDVKLATTNRIASGGPRLAGCLPNFEKLVRVGIPGLIREVETGKARASGDTGELPARALGSPTLADKLPVAPGEQGGSQRSGDATFYEGMRLALELLANVCRLYADQARGQARDASPARNAELIEMAGVLDHIAIAPPQTFHQAIQLFWLYIMVSGVVNYGRMDVFLGDFYAADIDSGRLTEPQALALLQSLWQLIADRKIAFNSRVILGGLGRPNAKNADRFALLAMEATRTVVETEPQLTLRFHKDQDPALMKKALDVIGEGRTYPMLYNDDVNVPAVAHCFGVPLADAEQYIPYGCGEYALDHISFGSPNCGFNLLKALESVLHNGKDALTGTALGLQLGDIATFPTFDDLWAAYARQVEHHAEHLCRRHAIEYEVEKQAAPFLFVSMLYDGCIERGRSVVDRGPRYTGAVLESFGLVNAADSLTAIEDLVYDRKVLTLRQLIDALDANFVGQERIHKLLLNAGKYGNDDDAADAMVQRVSDHVCEITRAQASKVGLDYCAVVNINNYANVTHGQWCAASADGRRNGEPIANGSTPTAGRDRKGITALLNSLVKVNPTVHAGYTHNMKFSRQMFASDRPKLEALLDGYFASGGTQAMITVVSRGDLENAMKEPEKYANLIVRVGGFSARFVELGREVQEDLLHRTLY